MHRNHIGGILSQPALQLVLVRDIDGLEARMAFAVAVVPVVAAVEVGTDGTDEVHVGELGGLEALPEFGAPALDLGYRVAKGHVAEGLGGLGKRGAREKGEN